MDNYVTNDTQFDVREHEVFCTKAGNFNEDFDEQLINWWICGIEYPRFGQIQKNADRCCFLVLFLFPMVFSFCLHYFFPEAMKRCLLSPPKHHILLGMRLDTAIQRDLTNQNEDLAKNIYCLCTCIYIYIYIYIYPTSGNLA